MFQFVFVLLDSKEILLWLVLKLDVAATQIVPQMKSVDSLQEVLTQGKNVNHFATPENVQ